MWPIEIKIILCEVYMRKSGGLFIVLKITNYDKDFILLFLYISKIWLGINRSILFLY